jgi:hypothetical protein
MAVPRALPAPADGVDFARLVFPGTELRHDRILRTLLTAGALSFKPVGSTSTVFQTRLAGGIDGAFKAVTRARPRGPASEVAAYRVGRCLGLHNVAPAVSRSFPASQLRAQLREQDRGAWPEIRERLGVGDDGLVRGAMIYWIEDLTDVGVDGPRGIGRWSRWLGADSVVPGSRRALVASVSTTNAFDYLIGNFDRYSGSNAKGDPAHTRVYLRDHDMAFPPRLDEARHRKLMRWLLRTERFSRSFYARLRGLSRECVERELARDPGGVPGALVGKASLDGVFERRRILLSHIESLVRLHGYHRVLPFE